MGPPTRPPDRIVRFLVWLALIGIRDRRHLATGDELLMVSRHPCPTESDSDRAKRQAACLHYLRRLGPSALPYRYVCLKCLKRLKIASGVHEPGRRTG